MNKKVIFIILITFAALGGLILYAYGPASHPAVGPTVNPASLKLTPTQNNGAGKNIALNTYHNKDLTENFYTIQFPQSWISQPNQAGSYVFTFDGGTAKVETIDVADNSTLELLILSQDEPKLKNSVIGYARISYHKLSVNGNDSYQLVYTSSQNGVTYQTARTYITGADKAGLITLTIKADQSGSVASVFNTIIDSFHWEK